MKDIEYLELAAKAAGVRRELMDNGEPFFIGEATDHAWNPLDYNDDALWLAATLELEVMVMRGFGEVWCEDQYGIHRARSEMSDDRAKDYRSAIVWCAAEIGADLK